MNRLARWMIRLYPASWRIRYGDELDALISDTGADVRIVGDLARGGMRMQMKAWPFALLAMVLGLAGLGVGAGISFLIPRVYQSQATLRMESSADKTSTIEEVQRLAGEALNRATLADIIQQIDLYPDERRGIPLEDVVNKMRRAIYIGFAAPAGHPENVAFNIRFDYRDARKAQQTVAAIVVHFQQELPRLEQRESASTGSAAIEVLDRPSLPQSPVRPNRLISSVVNGIGMGFLLSKESYLSEATVGIQMPKEQLTDLMTQVMSRGNLKQVIEKAGLFEEERRHTPLEDVIDEMRRNIHVDPVSGSKQQTIFDVRFEYTDRVKAQKVVSALLSEFEREASSTVTAAPSLAGRSPAPVLEVLDEPNIPLRPMKPNRVMVSSASGIGGVLLAGIISLVRRRWKPVQKQSVNS